MTIQNRLISVWYLITHLHTFDWDIVHKYPKPGLSWFRSLNTRHAILKHMYYSKSAEPCKTNNKCVVMLFDGRIGHGGVADRLRGITAIYQICKEMGVDFKISFTTPFDLKKALVPNKVDWTIDESDICYNSNDAVAYSIMNKSYKFPYEVQKQLIKDIINKPYKQIHLYSNASFTYDDGTFSELTYELFSLSDNFRNDLQQHFNILGENYICVTGRFVAALGDFQDITVKKLNDKEQKDLLRRSVEQVEKIHQLYPDHKIVITSDSGRFLEAVKTLDYTYIIVDCKRENLVYTKIRDFDILKKSLIDFALIAFSKRAIQIKGAGMYGGNFAYAASRVKDIPYELIEF